MACKTCGDKPKDGRHFPSAVIEINNPESLVLLRKVIIPASLGDDTAVPPAIGKYRNVILQYEANEHLYLYSSDGIPTKIDSTVPQEVLDRITELELDVDSLETSLAIETDARERADQGLQQEIDDLKNSPDVVDIVATYADLMAYDTSSLGDKDVIRVLADETHEGQSTYYRWNLATQTWTYIGAVGNYYTKDQIDNLLDDKQDELTPGENVSIIDESGELVISAQDTTYTAGYGLELNGTEFSVDSSVVQDTLVAGDNITIEDESGSLVISATDTTYNNFVGTDGTTAGQAGLVPAPATTDAGKVLGANGNWVTGGPTVVQTTGISTTDVMSQRAVTGTVFPLRGVSGYDTGSISISGSYGNGNNTITLLGQTGWGYGSVAIGASSRATGGGAIALGLGAQATTQGQFDISTNNPSSAGYNNSNYRLLTGLYDPQSAHDAATKNYVDVSPAFKPFPASVDTTHTTQAFMSSILALNPTVGTVYLGTVSLTDMPAGLMQEEVEVYVYSSYVVYCTMRSTDVAPYAWWCASYNYQGWRPVNTDTTYSAGSGLTLTGTTFSVDTTTIPTQSELTAALADKQDILTAGDNITIEDESGDLVISATDTTYTAGTGIAINNGVISATSTGPTVVQTPGTSATDVMSQNATTSMVFADPADRTKVQIGSNASASGNNNTIAIGNAQATAVASIAMGTYTQATSSGHSSIAIGNGANAKSGSSIQIGSKRNGSDGASGNGSIAIGTNTKTLGYGAIALGAYSGDYAVAGTVDISSSNTSYGYNSSNYRVLTGLYDPQSDHDAATKGYTDTQLSYKQDELTAGTGISIAEESGALVISATGAQIATINAQDWSALWQ